jgi:hypothetical protein
MTTLDHLDPFATTSSLGADDEDPERITAGKYRLPDLIVGQDGRLITALPGVPRKGGWTRVTTMVKAIADARALDLWHQRMLLVGIALRPDLYDLVCATLSGRDLTGDPTLRDELVELANRILVASGADVGANLGTAFHGFSEAQDLGLIHYAHRRWHGKLANYAASLAAHRLEVIPELTERRIVVLRYGLAGTLDRILLDQVTGDLRIGDIKSQKAFWTWLEISAQLAAYQMADAMWDRLRRCYVEFPKVADDLAVVMWAPQVHPEGADRVDLFNVDLAKGREILEQSHKAHTLRAEVRAKGQTIGLLRPLPAMSLVETYAQRLDAVETRSEGSALWAEITTRGLAGVPELLSLAAEVVARLTPIRQLTS